MLCVTGVPPTAVAFRATKVVSQFVISGGYDNGFAKIS